MTLASSAPFTAHADFWNTCDWDQAKLRSLVDGCLNADKDCSVFRGTTSGYTWLDHVGRRRQHHHG